MVIDLSDLENPHGQNLFDWYTNEDLAECMRGVKR